MTKTARDGGRSLWELRSAARRVQPENQFEFTYAFLIRSEEKSRNVSEVAIYLLLILGAVIAIWQFAQQPVNIPAAGLDAGGCVACVDDLRALRQVRHPEVKG